VWSDGTKVTYTNWKTDEPNDAYIGEDCVQLKHGHWNDISCAKNYTFVCKLPCEEFDVL